MRKVPPGAFFALLPHMEGLSDYEMPQKVAQNYGLALLLIWYAALPTKKSCRSGKIQYMLKNPCFGPLWLRMPCLRVHRCPPNTSYPPAGHQRQNNRRWRSGSANLVADTTPPETSSPFSATDPATKPLIRAPYLFSVASSLPGCAESQCLLPKVARGELQP